MNAALHARERLAVCAARIAHTRCGAASPPRHQPTTHTHTHPYSGLAVTRASPSALDAAARAATSRVGCMWEKMQPVSVSALVSLRAHAALPPPQDSSKYLLKGRRHACERAAGGSRAKGGPHRARRSRAILLARATEREEEYEFGALQVLRVSGKSSTRAFCLARAALIDSESARGWRRRRALSARAAAVAAR